MHSWGITARKSRDRGFRARAVAMVDYAVKTGVFHGDRCGILRRPRLVVAIIAQNKPRLLLFLADDTGEKSTLRLVLSV